MMRWTYYIYTPLDFEEVRRLEDQYSQEFERFLSDNPEIGDYNEGTGMVFVSKNVPSLEEVKQTNAEFEIELADSLLGRLRGCRSVIEIENPLPPDASRLQVSTLRFLLEKAGSGIMDWGDHQLQPCEDALAKINQMRSFGVMGETKVTLQDAFSLPDAFEARANRIMHLFQMAEADAELAVDIQKLIARQPTLVQQYMAYLFRNGPVSDKDAAKALGVTRDKLSPLLDSLDERLDILSEI